MIKRPRAVACAQASWATNSWFNSVLTMLNFSIEKRRTLILASNGILFVLSASFGLFKYAQLGGNSFPYTAAIICFFISLNSVYLLRGGDLVVSEAVMMSILLLGYFGATANSGGFDGAPSTLAPILPMVAILWFGAQAGWKILAILLCALTAILFLDLNEVFAPSEHSREAIKISHYISAVLASLICTWVTWAFAKTKEQDNLHNEQQARTDHLTGLANRRELDAALLREVSRTQRDGSWLSLIMADVDYFKRFNDTNGHQAGDICLITVAKLIAEAAKRPSDIASRFGGEEFAVLLPSTGSEGALIVAERIRKAISDAQIPYDLGGEDFLCVTLGVITIEGSAIESAQDLIAEADAALYRGKSSGRNKVVFKTIGASNFKKVRYA